VRDRDSRDLRDVRDIRDRDRRDPYLPRRPDDRRTDSRPEPRSELRPPPPEIPKTRIVKRKRM
jgi:CTD kinase subunit alpha